MGRGEAEAAYRPQSCDTDLWAERMLFDHWRRMEPWEKAGLVSELSESVHRLSLAGLAARFPDETPAELEQRAVVLRLGADLARWASRRASRS